MKEPKHANIPLFIPHLGCPCRCVFCDQRSISGSGAFIYENARRTLEKALAFLGGRPAEIAFFGGSFTAIDRTLMVELLKMAAFHKENGSVLGIRLSTRPDCTDEEVLSILSAYGVTAIELGVQSMDDEVLAASGRGHTAKDTEKAFERIKKFAFPSLVGQMMLGLPGSDAEKDLFTARRICEMGADGARIYPTVVLRGTELERMMRSGDYTPLTIAEGVRRGAECAKVFDARGVKILRMGLCAEEDCANAAVGGCYHPAYGELVKSFLYRERLEQLFENDPPQAGETYTVYSAPDEISSVAGYKRQNILQLSEKYGCVLRVRGEEELARRQVRVVKGEHRALKKS